MHIASLATNFTLMFTSLLFIYDVIHDTTLVHCSLI